MPINYKCNCSTNQPEAKCFWYYLINTNIGTDGNYYSPTASYQITTDVFGTVNCSAFANNPNDGIYIYAQAVGINGVSDLWQNTTPSSQGGLLSYYGTATQQNNYNFVFTNSLFQPVVSGWIQGLSCSLRCFEHSFQKPDLQVAIVQLDSQNNISSYYAPFIGSVYTLDLTNPADVLNFETLIKNIFGIQATVTAQYPASGNVILKINYVYTDQITFFMGLGSTHIMSEITCP
jgi:hypothetical protein